RFLVSLCDPLMSRPVASRLSLHDALPILSAHIRSPPALYLSGNVGSSPSKIVWLRPLNLCDSLPSANSIERIPAADDRATVIFSPCRETFLATTGVAGTVTGRIDNLSRSSAKTVTRRPATIGLGAIIPTTVEEVAGVLRRTSRPSKTP